MKKILFVCTGNTCRSPMAEALLSKILNERYGQDNKFTVSSVGIYAFEGDPASYEAVEVLKDEYGIDISSYRAKVFYDHHIKESYLILTMTEHHRKMILDIYPDAADKVFTLKDFAQEKDTNKDVCDPFGLDYDTYKECANEIQKLLLKIVDYIE